MNYFLYNIYGGDDLLSKVTAGEKFEWHNFSNVNPSVEDIIVASNAARVFYFLKVIEVKDTSVIFKKEFEVYSEKYIAFKKDEVLRSISSIEYSELLNEVLKQYHLEEQNFEKKQSVKQSFAKWLNEKSENNYFESDYDKTIKGLTAIASEYEKSFNYDVFEVTSGEEIEKFKKEILENIFKEETSFHDFSASKSNHMPRALLGGKNYMLFLEEYFSDSQRKIMSVDPQIDFSLASFIVSLEKANLYFDPRLVTRFVSSLVTKPFVLLNGLSGSGKTKLAQAFVQWICQEESQYKIIPVGADWTNREPLLGYPDGLNSAMYVTPDNGALQVMLDAKNNPNLPFFLILDEMNLSHVERYFADFLSIMESKDSIKLYTGEGRVDTQGTSIPQTLVWPKNLFVIGTVNIDETTYMFSPKVLDRANVIEFRLSENELEQFFSLTDVVDLEALVSGGATMSYGFLELAKSELKANDKAVQDELVAFFKALSNVGAEFGYRTANEVLQLINQLGALDASMHINDKIDIAVMQKLLPKLHGSRSKIVKVLEILAALCLINAKDFDLTKGEQNVYNIKYPISYVKLMRMYHNVIANGFTSYAEA